VAALVFLLAAALSGCRSSGPPPPVASAPATATAPAGAPPPPAPARPPLDLSSPLALTRTFIAVVAAGDWDDVPALVPPASQAAARVDIKAVGAAQKAKIQKTARKLADALARGPTPEFVVIEAVLAEPTHQEWYYCGEKPQGKYWASPCAFSVIEVDGRWYYLSVTDDND
jgi:hypothetical protein